MANSFEVTEWRDLDMPYGQKVEVQVLTGEGEEWLKGTVVARTDLEPDPATPPKWLYYIQMDNTDSPPRQAQRGELRHI